MCIFTQIVNRFKDMMKNIPFFSLIVPNSKGWMPFCVKDPLKAPQNCDTDLTVCFKEVWRVKKLFYITTKKKKKSRHFCVSGGDWEVSDGGVGQTKQAVNI